MRGPEIPAEEGLFHYPAFKNASCPTFREATDRFIYIAWNVYRVDAGNPHFGNVAFVYTAGQALNKTLIAPMDTGIWEMGTVRVFRQKFTIEDTIGSHACSLQVKRACV
jgi:hypothetical protein